MANGEDGDCSPWALVRDFTRRNGLVETPPLDLNPELREAERKVANQENRNLAIGLILDELLPIPDDADSELVEIINHERHRLVMNEGWAAMSLVWLDDIYCDLFFEEDAA